ncbi:MAG: DUF3592 domain-containing protein [Candidatus Sumerlaeia bacterium]
MASKTKSIAARGSSKNAKGCLLLFFFIFFAVGSVAFYFMFIKPMAALHRARNWVETPCVIVHSEVRVRSGDDGPTYGVYIEYEYEYQGEVYTDDRYMFTDIYSSGRRNKQSVVDQYPPGRKSTCFVNPDNPSESVKRKKFSKSYLIGLFPLIFVLIGAGGIFFALFGGSISRRRKTISADASAGNLSWAPKVKAAHAPDPDRDTGFPRRSMQDSADGFLMKSQASPVAKFLVMLIFALFWNSIVGFMLIQVVKEKSIALMIFGGVFGIIGLLLIAMVVSNFLALFNPRPQVRISDLSPGIGHSFKISWTTLGNVSRISMFRIILSCREEATYRRGTSTYTDRNKFFNMPIVETGDRANMVSGQATATIPPDAMHSFESPNNRIIWTIRVHGDIEKWPDVEEEYKIQVLPEALEKEGA